MRLSIRWKMLALLLLIAVLPLLVVTAVEQRSARRLGTDLARRTEHIITTVSHEHLRTLAEEAARTIYRERQLIELALRKQALEADARLAHPVPPPDRRPVVWTDADFNGSRVPDLRPSRRHFRAGVDGAPGDDPADHTRISTDHHVTRLAPGVDPAVVADDVARLSTMEDVYRTLYAAYPDLIVWAYVSLDSGVHTAFPGKGGYPVDYDGRARPWFQFARSRGKLGWTAPLRDALTGQVILTAVLPVTRADGAFAGVAAIDVSMNDLLGRVRLPEPWRDTATVSFVHFDRDETGDVPRVMVQNDDAGAAWERMFDLPELAVDAGPERDGLIADMTARRAGSRRLLVGGEPQLAVYQPVTDAGTFLWVQLPEATLAAAGAQVEAMMLQRTWRQLQLTASLALGVMTLVVVVGFLVSRWITRPVLQLSEAAAKVAGGDLDTRVNLRGHRDEIGDLAAAFNAMVPRLKDAMNLRQSLALAMDVQQCLLPEAPPVIPGLDIAGHSYYCDQTGGDYFDFITLDEAAPGTLSVAVGDVMGHGVAAALLMCTARALLRGRVAEPHALEDVITHVNRHLTSERLTGKFMTLYALVIDTTARRVRFVSAGHDPAIVYRPATRDFEEWEGADPPLGIDASIQYESFTREGWAAGDVVVIGTDGIWEARNPAMEQFGKDRLRDLIREHAAAPAATIARAITDAVKHHRGPKPQEDDITLVVVKMT